MKGKSTANSIGKLGENIASEYLNKKGYNVILRNFHTSYGEIDIIACDSQYIIFAEVKTRNQYSIARPSEWVDKRKQRKLIITASEYMQKNQTELQPRFDIIEIIVEKGRTEPISINHIENAFIQEGEYATF